MKRCVLEMCILSLSLSSNSAQKTEKMVRGSVKVLKDAASGINKTLYERLVCPLSRQPLRFCEETNSLISDAVGVSFPIKNGIPSLVPADGKILNTDAVKSEEGGESSGKQEADVIT